MPGPVGMTVPERHGEPEGAEILPAPAPHQLLIARVQVERVETRTFQVLCQAFVKEPVMLIPRTVRDVGDSVVEYDRQDGYVEGIRFLRHLPQLFE